MQKFILVMITVLLLGCTSTKSTEYLLQHPEELQKQLMLCQINNTQTPFCNQIRQVAAEFAMLIAQHNEAPERFGQEIMIAELILVKMKTTLQEAQQDYHKVTTSNSSEEDRAKAKEKLDKSQQAYQDQLQKVQMLLAVVR